MLAHIWEHKVFLFSGFLMFLVSYSSLSYARILIGEAADEILNPTGSDGVVRISLLILGVLVLDGVASLGGSLSVA